MPEHHPGQLGGTMRLGKRRTLFKSDQSLLSKFKIKSLIDSVASCKTISVIYLV